MSLYGSPPIDLGMVDITNDETQMCLYMPIKVDGGFYTHVPAQYQKFLPIINQVYFDTDDETWLRSYVYLTVKSMYVQGECTGQRAGWHTDGFMTDDINYIWYDRSPTVFHTPEELIELPQDHRESIREMSICAFPNSRDWVNFPNKHLLKLDQYNIHKSQDTMEAGFRNFIKVSVSDGIYALKGNTKNPVDWVKRHTDTWEYIERGIDRNCPKTN